MEFADPKWLWPLTSQRPSWPLPHIFSPLWNPCANRTLWETYSHTAYALLLPSQSSFPVENTSITHPYIPLEMQHLCYNLNMYHPALLVLHRLLFMLLLHWHPISPCCSLLFQSSQPIYEDEAKQIRCLNAQTLKCCAYNQRTVLIVCSKYWQVKQPITSPVDWFSLWTPHALSSPCYLQHLHNMVKHIHGSVSHILFQIVPRWMTPVYKMQWWP